MRIRNEDRQGLSRRSLYGGQILYKEAVEIVANRKRIL
jgi:hypothetical protein